MPSVLVSQLKALNERTREGLVPTGEQSSKKKASLVFDAREAADLDRQAILTVGLGGLAKLEERCLGIRERYEQALFSESSATVFRENLTAQENAELDFVVENFLFEVAPHFLEPATASCLEWLIRQYSVHEYNIVAIFQAFAPYHETVAFLKLVSLCRFGEHHPLSFLNKVSAAQTPLDRATLVRRCLHDASILNQFFEGSKRVARLRLAYSTFWTFLTALLMEYVVLAASEGGQMTLPESSLRLLVPFLIVALKEVECAEAQLCAYVVLSHVSAFSCMRDDVLGTLQTLIAKYARLDQRPQAFLTLLQLAQTQPPKQMSKKALLNLLAWDDLVQLVEEAKQAYDCRELLKMISAQARKLPASQRSLNNMDLVLRVVNAEEEVAPPAHNGPVGDNLQEDAWKMKEPRVPKLALELQDLAAEAPSESKSKRVLSVANQQRSEEFKGLLQLLLSENSDLGRDVLVGALLVARQVAATVDDSARDWKLAEQLFDGISRRLSCYETDYECKPSAQAPRSLMAALVCDFARAAISATGPPKDADTFAFRILLQCNAPKALIDDLVLKRLAEVFPRCISTLLLSGVLQQRRQVFALRLLIDFLQTLLARGGSYDCQMLLPAVMHAFTSSERSIRTSAIALLETMESLFSARRDSAGNGATGANGAAGAKLLIPTRDEFPYLNKGNWSMITKLLLAHAPSIESDPGYLLNWLGGEYWVRAPSGSRALFEFLLANLRLVNSVVAKSFVLSLLRGARHPGRLAYTIPEIKATKDVAYLRLLIQSFGAEQSFGALESDDSSFDAFISFLDAESSCLPPSVRGELLGLVTSKWLFPLSTEKQAKLFQKLVHILLTDYEAAQRCAAMLKDLPFDAYAVASFLQRLSVQISDEGIDAAYSSLSSLLEIVDANRNWRNGSEALISPLFKLLSYLQQVKTDVPLEYLKQLTLQAITSLLEAREDGNGTIDEGSLQLDTLIDVLRATDAPQTHNQACLLLVALCHSHPGLVLNNLLPLVTLLGTSLVRKEDDYSFSVVQKLLEAVLPTVARHANQGVLQSGDATKVLAPVFQVFIGALSRVPPHRRVRLLSVLVSSLGSKDYLGVCLAMLLFRPVPGLGTDHSVEHASELLTQPEFDTRCQVGAITFLLQNLPQVDVDASKAGNVPVLSSLFGAESFTSRGPVVQSFYRTFLFLSVHFGRIDPLSLGTSSADVPDAELQTLLSLLLDKRDELRRLGDDLAAEKRFKHAVKAADECLRLFALQSLSLDKFMSSCLGLMVQRGPDCGSVVTLLHERVNVTKHKLFAECQSSVYPLLQHLCDLLSSQDARMDTVCRQQALLTVNTFCGALCSLQPQRFSQVLSIVTSDKCLDVRVAQVDVVSASLVTLATLVKTLQVKVLPLLPKFMPLLLSVEMCELIRGEDVSHKVLKAGLLSALEVAVSRLSLFMEPYLVTILNLLLDPFLWPHANVTSLAKGGNSALLLDLQTQEQAKKIIATLTAKVDPSVLFKVSREFISGKLA